MIDLYSFLIEKISQREDVCKDCIYNVNNKCTFEGDPNFAQLPVGCPKRPDTQKTFGFYALMKLAEEAKKIEAKIDSDFTLVFNKFMNASVETDPSKFSSMVEEAINSLRFLCKRYRLDYSMLFEANVDRLLSLIDGKISPKERKKAAQICREIAMDVYEKEIEEKEELSKQLAAKRKEISKNLLKKGQVFAPGPGPWEGSTTNEISEEVSYSSPARWDAGPFGMNSRIRVPTDTPRSRRIIAQAVNMLGESATNSTVTTENEIVCPGCGKRIPAGVSRCPNCGFDLLMGKNASNFKLCYFCGQPVSNADSYVIVIDSRDNDIVGVAHLTCAQTASDQYQGHFDENGDFLINVPPDKAKGEEDISQLDEVVLIDDFNNFKAGEKGRILSDEEVKEMGFSPIRVDGKVFVKFDKDPRNPVLVPVEKLRRTSDLINGLKKEGKFIQCPFGRVNYTLVVLDHCYLATDDESDVFGCHVKSCKYHRPVSPAEWDRLVDLSLKDPFNMLGTTF